MEVAPLLESDHVRNAGHYHRIYECPFGRVMGICDFISTLFMLVVIFVLGRVQDKDVDEIDEAVQTSQDYSIEVEDPGDGKEDNDPNEWKRFFEQFGQVTAVTIAKKNGTSLSAVEALAGKKAMAKTPTGQYIKVGKKWKKK